MYPLYTLSALTFIALVSKRHLFKRSKSPLNSSREDESSSETKNPLPEDWQWSIYDQFEGQYGEIDLKKRSAPLDTEDPETGPFRVIYRKKAHQLWPDVVQIVLSSPALIKIIQKHLPNDGDLQSLAEPTIGARDLFIVLDALKNDGSGDGGGAGDDPLDETELLEGKNHLKHLVRFMEKEYRDIPARFRRMTEEKRVPWDLLWTFLPRGKRVVYNCDQTQQPLCATVASNYYFYNEYMPQGWFFLLELDVWDYDGRSYQKCQIRRQIARFQGERNFAKLPVRPIEMAGSPEVLEAEFLANGRRFQELAMKKSHRFMHYAGPLFQQRQTSSCWQLYKENADGRVMIDLASFAKMNPDYPMGNARQVESSRYWVPQGYGGGEIEFKAPSDEGFSNEEQEVSDENLIFAPAFVYGFSFTLKQWGCFAINGFREITFDTHAFDALVMEPQMKGLVHNLVGQYIATPVDGSHGKLHRVDPISSKGEGCIFLCYGPPGTGKTLTAESVAENMRRPLWALSVSELGTTPAELEKTLFKVLDIAATWQAVLLLDEADVYLEKRISGADLTRNAMTGVFLRLLEYYRGVLFLTTNRIGTFDDAFRSRISMFLRYRQLTTQQKEQVWKTLLERARVENVSTKFLADLASEDLNGREIRNAVHTAQIWARSNGQTPEASHVRYVITVLGRSLEELKDALHHPTYRFLDSNGKISNGDC